MASQAKQFLELGAGKSLAEIHDLAYSMGGFMSEDGDEECDAFVFGDFSAAKIQRNNCAIRILT